MDTYTLDEKIDTLALTVTDFPMGIGEAFNTLADTLPNCQDRTFYGIFYFTPNGEMVYKTAVSAFAAEVVPPGYEAFVIPAGQYLTETIAMWQKDPELIHKTFAKLQGSPPTAQNPCVEWYKGNDVVCMVPAE